MASLDSKGLSELAGVIATRAKEIESYLSTHNSPQPSLHSADLESDFLPSGNETLQKARTELVDAAALIAELAQAPYKNFVDKFLFTHVHLYCLSIVDGFDVAEHVPVEGSISYNELSSKCGVDEATLRRVLRYLMTSRFFAEDAAGRVKHTATSKPLASDRMSRHIFGHVMKNSAAAVPGAVEALKRWPGKADPTHCAFAAANGGKTVWDILKVDKQRQEHFNGAMEFAGRASKLGLEPAGPSFDWTNLPRDALVVDCGGGVGHMSKSLAEQYPHLRFVVQDLDQVLSEVPETSVMDGRVKFETYSFFDPQPVKHADVYMFRRIFHDWPDSDSQKIIEALVPSMKEGARLLVWDLVLPKPGSVSLSDEKMMRVQDVAMMAASGAQERSLDEWESLLSRSAGDKLKLESHGRMYLSYVRSP